jgi:protein-disulfide isomerase
MLLAIAFRRLRILAFALTVVVFFASVIVGCGASTEPAAKPSTPAVEGRGDAEPTPLAGATEGGPIPVSSADPIWGSKKALVTIVELADFQCPFCARSSTTMEQLRRDYGPDKLRIVWKHLPLPFHPEAKPAAEAAAGVMLVGGSDAFWKFHDRVFTNQMALSGASYEEWAKDAGVEPARLRKVVDSGAPRSKVEADGALARELGILGTPSFLINGVFVEGAQPYENFKAVIDTELEKARAKLSAGVPPEKIYTAMVADNFKGPHREEADGPEEEDDKRIYKMPVGKSPVSGPANALVTIVVFSDFQCPFCKRAEPTLAELDHRYPGVIRFVWKDLPLSFHKRAEPAAQLAQEARAQKGEATFWAAHDRLFESQPNLEDADLERVAGALSLDVKKALAAVRTHKYKASIDADGALADDFEVQGTPHFFINGRRLVGAQPLEKFVAVVDEQLARAKALVAKGTPPAAVYDALLKDGFGPSEPEKKLISVMAKAPVLGSPKAPVTVYVFSDFQCPFCARVEPTLAELRKAYGPKLRFIWRNMPLPFHPDAPLAAQAALEAQAQKGDTAFWKMHDLLFEGQAREGGLKREALDDYATKLGLDAKRFAEALDTHKHQSKIDEDAKSAAKAGISGTPTFIITSEGESKDGVNGYLLSGAQPIAKFKKMVERALADSRAAKAPPPTTKAVDPTSVRQ